VRVLVAVADAAAARVVAGSYSITVPSSTSKIPRLDAVFHYAGDLCRRDIYSPGTGELMRKLGADVHLGVELWKEDVDPRQAQRKKQ